MWGRAHDEEQWWAVQGMLGGGGGNMAFKQPPKQKTPEKNEDSIIRAQVSVQLLGLDDERPLSKGVKKPTFSRTVCVLALSLG